MRTVTTFAEAIALGPGEYRHNGHASYKGDARFRVPVLESGEWYLYDEIPRSVDLSIGAFVTPPVVAAREGEVLVKYADWCKYIDAADPHLRRRVTDGFSRSPAVLAPWWALEVAIFVPPKSRARASEIIRMARDATPDDRAALRAMLALSTEPADKRRMIYAWAKVVRLAKRRGGA